MTKKIRLTDDDGNSAPVNTNRLTTIFTGGLFIIVVFAVMRYASTLFIPITFAVVLKLVLQPIYRMLEKLRLPPALCAIVIIGALVCGTWSAGSLIASPAAEWTQRLPENLPALKEKLRVVSKPIEKTQQALAQADNLTKGSAGKSTPVSIQGPKLSDKIFLGTQSFVGGILTVVLLLFFFLMAGDTFLRRFVEILPSFDDKRRALGISNSIEKNMSAYLLTITLMNFIIGVVASIIMWYFGVDDPILWGFAAFALNYVPIVGPLSAAVLFFVVCLIKMDSVTDALIPTSMYYIAHFLESSYATPLLLARRFILNPVLVILSLMFWYWMWGLPGAILAVPLLAMTKIICDGVEILNPIGHFLGR